MADLSYYYEGIYLSDDEEKFDQARHGEDIRKHLAELTRSPTVKSRRRRFISPKFGNDEQQVDAAGPPEGDNAPRPYKCKFCAERFQKGCHLIDHLRGGKHLGLKPFGCAWKGCTHVCAARQNMLKHIRNTHISKLNTAALLRLNSTEPEFYVETNWQLMAIIDDEDDGTMSD